ncbi:MAG: toxin-antitoxin system YwqK family antitoxin [Sphingobacteriaceae bacterium]
MKIFISLTIYMFGLTALAQKIPDLGLNKIRIIYPDKIVQAEILPVIPAQLSKPDRYYHWYSANQIKTTQGGFSGRLLDGLYRSFYLSKGLKEQGVFKNGLKTGVWRNWDEDGNLRDIFTWHKGLKEGFFQLYDPIGHISETGSYHEDLLHGIYITHASKDTVEIKKYKRGQLILAKRPSRLWQRFGLKKRTTPDSSSGKDQPATVRWKQDKGVGLLIP